MARSSRTAQREALAHEIALFGAMLASVDGKTVAAAVKQIRGA